MFEKLASSYRVKNLSCRKIGKEQEEVVLK